MHKTSITNEITIRENGNVRVQKLFNKKSRTQQQFRDQVDINNLVKKYTLNKLEDTWVFDPQNYSDFSNVGSLQDAAQKVIDAESTFSKLPSTLRTKFQNNPQNLIDFLSNPKNKDEAIELGLFKTPPPPPTTPTISLDDATISKLQTSKKAKIVYED